MTETGQDPAEIVAARVIIGGRVQGVAYRWSMQNEALRQGVKGWVRNQPDGTVAAYVEGRRDAVEATLAWCWQGPAVAQVNRVDVDWGDFLGPTGEQRPVGRLPILRLTGSCEEAERKDDDGSEGSHGRRPFKASVDGIAGFRRQSSPVATPVVKCPAAFPEPMRRVMMAAFAELVAAFSCSPGSPGASWWHTHVAEE